MSASSKSKDTKASSPATNAGESKSILRKRMPWRNVSLRTPQALVELAESQRQTAAEKKKLTHEVRYAKRKRARTMRSVSLWSDEDLAALIEERNVKKAAEEENVPDDKAREPEEKASDAEDAHNS